MQHILRMKTDNKSFDIDIAALLRNVYTGFRLCTPAYIYTEDTRLLFQFPSRSPPNVGTPSGRYDSLKKGKMRKTTSPPLRSYDQHASLSD
jgi:hypothetical protein